MLGLIKSLIKCKKSQLGWIEFKYLMLGVLIGLVIGIVLCVLIGKGVVFSGLNFICPKVKV